jgi:hypothetical protein
LLVGRCGGGMGVGYLLLLLMCVITCTAAVQCWGAYLVAACLGSGCCSHVPGCV